MAYITTNRCITCGHTWQGIGGSTECTECYSSRIGREKREYFGALDALTIEERIRRIEEWIYYYKPEYVPPPRY